MTELTVGEAFYSPSMTPAEGVFAASLAATPLRGACRPVMSNTTARPAPSAADLKAALRPQITASVRREQSVDTMLDLGGETFAEVGPGRTLLGLLRHIAAKRGARPRLLNVQDAASLEKTVAAVARD